MNVISHLSFMQILKALFVLRAGMSPLFQTPHNRSDNLKDQSGEDMHSQHPAFNGLFDRSCLCHDLKENNIFLV